MSGITVWSYSPIEEGGNVERDGQRFLYSGIGSAVMEEEINGEKWGYLPDWIRTLKKDGHAITVPYSYDKPWNHNVIGCGVGHNDAEFCESRHSMAAYYENGEAHHGKWWENFCLYCKTDMYTNGTTVNGSPPCHGDHSRGTHVPWPYTEYKYYDPTRTMSERDFSNHSDDGLMRLLIMLRKMADRALKAKQWEAHTKRTKAIIEIANEIRRRQQAEEDAHYAYMILDVDYDERTDYGRALSWLAQSLKDSKLEMTEDHNTNDADEEYEVIVHRKWAGFVSREEWDKLVNEWSIDLDDSTQNLGMITEYGNLPAYAFNWSGMDWNMGGETPISYVSMYVCIQGRGN